MNGLESERSRTPACQANGLRMRTRLKVSIRATGPEWSARKVFSWEHMNIVLEDEVLHDQRTEPEAKKTGLDFKGKALEMKELLRSQTSKSKARNISFDMNNVLKEASLGLEVQHHDETQA